MTKADGLNVKDGTITVACDGAGAYEILAEIDLSAAECAGLKLHSDGACFTSIAYDKTLKKLVLDRINSRKNLAPHYNKKYLSEDFDLKNNVLKLGIFVDGPIIEIFAQDGLYLASALSYPKFENQAKIEIFSQNGSASAKKLMIYPLMLP